MPHQIIKTKLYNDMKVMGFHSIFSNDIIRRYSVRRLKRYVPSEVRYGSFFDR